MEGLSQLVHGSAQSGYLVVGFERDPLGKVIPRVFEGDIRHNPQRFSNIPDQVLVIDDRSHQVDGQQQQRDAFCVQFISLKFIQLVTDDEHSSLSLQFKSVNKNHQEQRIIFLVLYGDPAEIVHVTVDRIENLIIRQNILQKQFGLPLQFRILHGKAALIPHFDVIGQFRIQGLGSLRLREINFRVGHNRILVRGDFLLQQFVISIFDRVHTDDCVADIHQSHDGYSQKSQ
ncbi:hypothetical protein SDC9_146164 [bioreactor metagenome]|uniref:Uncharacterized protein n=1 Tax=bioreactor metagenome TaxID=1076179 RepID=A0A645EAB7_9ZZZZ